MRTDTHTSTKPILVCMVWRGGERFHRCLSSIASSQEHFSRIILSITSTPDSPDMHLASEFQEAHPQVEVICTQTEMPTMQHQSFWIDYLKKTGARSDDWVYWLAYDDEVRVRGIRALINDRGDWPLRTGTCYFGPWAMRHESADRLFDGPADQPLESWTSFPADGPTKLPVLIWIGDQLAQPTYMQMSGSVAQFGCYLALRHAKPPKQGPMRIEMAIAAAPPNRFVQEFAEPVSIIYGRSNSDRAAYGKAARSEDIHLMRWLGHYLRRNPQELGSAFSASLKAITNYARSIVTRRSLPQEEWRVRGMVSP